MARPLNLAANPLRLLLLLGLLLLGALLVGFNLSLQPIHPAGSHSLPVSGLITVPNAGSQPAAGTVANQATTPTITRIVTGSAQAPASGAPAAAVEQVPAAPAAAGCQANPAPQAGRDIPASCSNP